MVFCFKIDVALCILRGGHPSGKFQMAECGAELLGSDDADQVSNYFWDKRMKKRRNYSVQNGIRDEDRREHGHGPNR